MISVSGTFINSERSRTVRLPVTTGRDFYNSPAYSTHVSIERQGDNYLSQTLTFGDNQASLGKSEKN